MAKGSPDLTITYDDYGLFTRARYWCDFELKDDKHTEADGLSKKGKDNASDTAFIDAYVWGDFWVDDKAFKLRPAYQVFSWGRGKHRYL